MAGRFVQSPERWLAAWAALIVAGFIAVQGVDRAILAYSERVRASDYRTFVAEAGRLADAGQIDEAFLSLETALRLAPYAPEPHLMVGHLHYRRQRWEDAILAYRRALQNGTPDIGARLNTVWAFIQLGRHADAVALGEVSMKSGFDTPLMARYVAEAQLRAGNFDEAIPHLQAALESFRNDLYLWEQLARAAREMGDEALEVRALARIESIQSRLDAFVEASP